jgi:uncharacterized protein (TIGR00730 family)
MLKLDRIAVFCGSRHGSRPAYGAAARELGRHLAERGIGIVYGGGNIGLMGELADAAIAHRGEVIGVIPECLVAKEVAHRGLTELRIVESMHERKAQMAALADAFITLPGGLGTFEELFEILTWSQLGLHQKPCGLLDVEGYFSGLDGMLDHAEAEGFVSETHRSLVYRSDRIDGLLDDFARHRAAVTPQWIDPETS